MKKDFSTSHTELSGHEILSLEGHTNLTFESLSKLSDSALRAGNEAYVRLKHVKGEFMQQPKHLEMEHVRVLFLMFGLPALLTWLIATKVNGLSAVIMLPLWIAIGVKGLSLMLEELKSSENKRLNYGDLLAFSKATNIPMEKITKMDLAVCSIFFTAKFKEKIDKLNAEYKRQQDEESAAYFKWAAGRDYPNSRGNRGYSRGRGSRRSYSDNSHTDGFDSHAYSPAARVSASGMDTGRIDSETNMSINMGDDRM